MAALEISTRQARSRRASKRVIAWLPGCLIGPIGLTGLIGLIVPADLAGLAVAKWLGGRTSERISAGMRGSAGVYVGWVAAEVGG